MADSKAHVFLYASSSILKYSTDDGPQVESPKALHIYAAGFLFSRPNSAWSSRGLSQDKVKCVVTVVSWLDGSEYCFPAFLCERNDARRIAQANWIQSGAAGKATLDSQAEIEQCLESQADPSMPVLERSARRKLGSDDRHEFPAGPKERRRSAGS